MAALVAIVVLGDEDLFCGFLEHFPSKQYALLCAGDVEEVQTFIEAGEPFLLVVNLDEVAPSLADTLRQARRGGAVVVGLTRGGKDPLHAALADWIVPRGEDVAALAAVLRDILAERRRSPRVALELPVRLKGAGEAVATTVSPTALFVLTERTLRAGATVPLTIEVDEGEELSCDATVVRVGRGESGRRGVVLGIPESAAAVRRLLQSLVERAAEVERGLRGRRAGDAPAGGDAAPPAPPAPDGAAALELSRPETTQVDLGAEVRGAAEAAIA
ncbi:MAG TPA: PilZ domain-containing protein, partial [Polyangia bacterium]